MYLNSPEYSKFDDNGVPTHDASGVELNKTTIKKLRRKRNKPTLLLNPSSQPPRNRPQSLSLQPLTTPLRKPLTKPLTTTLTQHPPWTRHQHRNSSNRTLLQSGSLNRCCGRNPAWEDQPGSC